MELNNRVNFQVLTVSFGKILAMLATFIVPVVLTRFLTKEDYGVYGQFNVVFLFCSAFFSFGVRSNLYYFYPNAEKHERKILVFQTLGILLILSILAALIVKIPYLNILFLGSSQLLMFTNFIAIIIILYMVSTITEPLYILRKDNILSALYPVSLVTLKGLTVVTFVVLVPSIESVLMALTLVFSLSFLFSLYYVFKEINFKRSGTLINIKLLKQQISYSLPFGLSVSIEAIITKLDKILCIAFISSKEYAIYSVAFLAIPGVQAIYDSLVQVYIIEMAKAFKRGNLNEIIKIYHDLLTKSFSFTLPSVVIIIYYSEFVITTLYTKDYIDSVPLFRLYLLGSISMLLGAGVILRSIGKTKIILKAYIISSFFTIPITYYLVSGFGLTGAMTSAIIAMIIPKSFLFYFDVREMGTNIFDFFPFKNLLKITGITMLSMFPVVLYNIFFSQTLWSILLTSTLFMFLVFYLEYRANLFVLDSKVVTKLVFNIKNKIGWKK